MWSPFEGFAELLGAEMVGLLNACHNKKCFSSGKQMHSLHETEAADVTIAVLPYSIDYNVRYVLIFSHTAAPLLFCSPGRI